MLKYIPERIYINQWLQKPFEKIEKETINLRDYFIKPIPQEYIERVNYELNLIHKLEFTTYFYQVVMILRQYKGLYICRGSAASSLVCYLLGITHIDPVTHNMNFARFLNPLRVTPPDIDLDFCHHQQKIVMESFYKLFPMRVGRIINHVYYRAKSAFNEILRQDKGYKSTSTYIKAQKLVGTLHYDSLHCGGLVVFPSIVPKKFRGLNKKSTTYSLNINKKEAEKEKLIKIDILSNRALSILSFLDEKRQIHEYPIDDPLTITLLKNYDVIGVPFIETPNMIKVMKKINPTTPIELSLCLALARPAANKFKKKKESDPLLVYDDDMIEYISSILDISYEEGESIRKGLSKGSEEVWTYFEKQCLKKFKRSKVNQILKHCKFVNYYSFCKSHSLNYAYLCWAILWHKAHNKGNFWCSVLNYNKSQYSKWVYFREIIQDGFKVECIKMKKTTEKRAWKIYKNYIYLSNSSYTQTKLTSFFTSPTTKTKFLDQINEFGYWVDDWPSELNVKYNKKGHIIEYSGLIAWIKELQINDSIISFITISTSPKTYYNVIVNRKINKDELILKGKCKQIDIYSLLTLNSDER